MTYNEQPDEMPLPLEISTDDDAMLSTFGPAGPSMDNAIGAAWLWWMALNNLPNYRTALENLTVNPDSFNGYDHAVEMFDGWALMTVPLERPEPADDIAAIKFRRDTGQTLRAFADAQLHEDLMVLTVVRCDDGLWRVWGYSFNDVPSNNRVRFGTD